VLLAHDLEAAVLQWRRVPIECRQRSGTEAPPCALRVGVPSRLELVREAVVHVNDDDAAARLEERLKLLDGAGDGSVPDRITEGVDAERQMKASGDGLHRFPKALRNLALRALRWWR